LSSLCTDEELTLFSALFRNALKMKHIDTFDGDIIRGFFKGFMPFREQGVRPFTAAHHILDSDLIITMFADPQKEAPVVASYIRVACLHRNAKLMNLSYGPSPFPGLVDLDIRLPEGQAVPKALSNLAEIIGKISLGPSDMAVLGNLRLELERPYLPIGSQSRKAPGPWARSQDCRRGCIDVDIS